MSTPFPNNPSSQDCPIPDTPTDMALHLTALRRLVVAWRERASTAAEREARVYRQAEADLAAVIAEHTSLQGLWRSVRQDLIDGITEAIAADREGRPERP